MRARAQEGGLAGAPAGIVCNRGGNVRAPPLPRGGSGCPAGPPPQKKKVHIQYAVAQYRHGNLSEAVGAFEKAIRHFPQSADVHNYYGEILLDQQRFDEAEALFERAAALAPDNALCFINQGLLAFQCRQDFAGAIELAKKAIAVDDRCDVAYAHLAQIYMQTGQQQQAIDNYEQGMQPRVTPCGP